MFRYTPSTIPSSVVVIGCGGTGSRLVPLLTQFIASISKDKNPRGWLESPTIFLYDDDVVEQKNLLRQNFVQPDVGKNKAVVLAQRYGRAYGVNVIPVDQRITNNLADSDKTQGVTIGNNPMVIMCVDTAQARRDIITTFDRHYVTPSLGSGPFYIDAGNEDNFGQVRFFNHAVAYSGDVFKELPKLSPVVVDIPAIPMDKAYYDGLQDSPGLGSCADLDQTLAINALMATLIMGVVQNYYYVRPMTFNEISVSLDGGVSTSYNTVQSFLKRDFNVAGGFNTSYAALQLKNYVLQYIKETDAVMKEMEKSAVQEQNPATNAPVPREIKPVRKRKSVTTPTALEAGVVGSLAEPTTTDVILAAQEILRAVETSSSDWDIPF